MTSVAGGPLAGAGRVRIELPDDLFVIDGYHGVHDPLHARVLVLDHDSRRHVVVSLELPSVRDREVARLRRRVADVAGTPVGRVWLTVTHTLSAPHVRSEAALADPDVARRDAIWCERLEDAVDAATSRALAGLAPGVIGAGEASVPLNVSRDLLLDGRWTHGADPAGYSDRTLTAVRVDSAGGEPVAVLYGYDLRSSVTAGAEMGHALVSADCTGAASRVVEAGWGGVAIFLPGAMADQMPDLADADAVAPAAPQDGRSGRAPTVYELSDAFGATLARHVVTVVQGAVVREPARIRAARTSVAVPTASTSPSSGSPTTLDLDLDLLLIGDVAVLGVKPELTSVLGSGIRAASPWPVTLVCTMLNGGARYLVDDEAHDRGTRTALASAFGRGAGEVVVRAARALLQPAETLQEHR